MIGKIILASRALHFYSRFYGWETGLILARGGLFEWTRVEDCTLCVVRIGRFNPGLYYRKVLGLRACGCTTMVSVLGWMIVCAIGGLRKKERARAKSRTSSFAHLYMPKDYFDFAIYPLNLYVIVGIEYI